MTEVSASQHLRDSPTTISPSLAWLLGWLGVALVNVGFVLRGALVSGDFTAGARASAPLVAFQHLLFDLGHFAALGLAFALLAWLWGRIASKRAFPPPLWSLLALFGLSLLGGAVLLPPDFQNFAVRIGGPAAGQVTVALTLVGSTSVAGAALFGRLLVRFRLRWLVLLLGLGVAMTNSLVLRADYVGIHIFVAWSAATLLAAAALGAKSARLAALSQPGRWFHWLPAALVTTLALASLLVSPPQSVLLRLHRLDGAVLVRAAARLDAWLHDRGVQVADSAEVTSAPGEPETSSTRTVDSDAIVILITIDSLRADVIEKPSYRKQLPHLVAMAKAGAWFSEARAPGASTRVTLGSIFTGKYRSQLRWARSKKVGNSLKLDKTRRFPKTLSDAGVQTYSVINYGPLREQHGIVSGFDKQHHLPSRHGQRWALASRMVDRLIRRLKRADGPLFLYTHLMDPHHPYDAAGAGGDDFERYLREVALCDRQIGRIWSTVEKLGIEDRVTLMVSSDHGEAFGQHGTPYHGVNLYEELVRVPLLIRGPRVLAQKIDEPVTLVDLGPTIVDWYGLPPPRRSMGQTLAPLLRGEPFEATRRIAGDNGVGIYSLVDGNYKMIWNRKLKTREIYDLRVDPDEKTNLFDTLGPAGPQKMGTLKAFLRKHRFKKFGSL